MNINQKARLETNMELEVLRQQRPKTPTEHRRLVERLQWLNQVKEFIDHVENLPQ